LRIVFAGTPRFAAVALEALLAGGECVVQVLTQPDRPAGRGRQPTASPVKALARSRGIPVAQPATLRDPAVQCDLAALEADVWIVAAYGLILPAACLALPRHGCINIHASLLPRWRGAAPIQRAILAGDATTGISIMQMDAGLDTGPVLLQESITIGRADTAGTLHDRLADLGAALVRRALDDLRQGVLRPTPQPAEGVTYAAKIDKQEAAIDWSGAADQIERQVRAFDPVPGAFALLDGVPVKLWRAHAEAGPEAPPGTVLEAGPDGLLISCGKGALSVAELQRPGGRRLPVDAFLRGQSISPGARFATVPQP